MEEFLTHAVIAENAEGEPAGKRRPDAVGNRDFAEGAPVGRAGDPERAHVADRDVPGPVEDRPGLHEPGVRHGVGIEAHEEFSDVRADRHHGVVENEGCVARNQDEREESEAEGDVEVGDPPHPARDRARSREREEQAEDKNHAELEFERVRNPEQVARKLAHHGRADPYRRHHRGEVAEDDGAVQKEARDALPERIAAQDADRKVGNAKRRALLVPKEIAHRQGRHEIEGPGREAPVEHPVGGRHFIGRARTGLDSERRRLDIEHPLAQAKNKNACGKRVADVHRVPGESLEHGLRVAAAETDVAVLGEEANEGDRRIGHAHEEKEPGEIFGEEVVEDLDHADRRLRDDDDRSDDDDENEGGEAHEGLVSGFEHDGWCMRTPICSYTEPTPRENTISPSYFPSGASWERNALRAR